MLQRKEGAGMDGITSDKFPRTFNKFPLIQTEIYNQSLKTGTFPRRWKTANMPIAKDGQEN